MPTQTPRLPAEPHRKQRTGSRLVMTAMILAVSMTFIDQTIVAIASPTIQRDLHLTGSQGQWVITAYLVALAATFALGGRVADVWGRRRMLLVGVVGFAATSALCGITPDTGVGRDLADRGPCRPGRLRGAADARGDRHRLRECVPREARPVDGDVLRADRRVHGAGPDPRRLPARLLVAGDLLGEPARRRGRGRPHPGRAHPRDPHPGADRLARSRAGRRRHGAERPRVLAVLELGLDQRRDPGLPRGRRRLPGCVRLRRAAHSGAAGAAEHLPRPGLPGRLRCAVPRDDRRSSRSATS